MCDDRDHRTYRLGVIVVAMAIRCSYGDSAYCRRTSIVLPWTGRRQRGVEATTNRSPGHRSLPQCGNERWSRWTIRRADTDTASVGVSYEPLTDAASLSAAAAHRRRRGRGERSCEHSDGTQPRRFFFNAFRLPPCTIVPVPYVPYGTGTIVHAGFVPYVRTDWKKKTKTRIDPGTALNPTFGNSARTKM
jgi:hypothetical protein